MDTVVSVVLASLRSVGTAMTMAFIGWYLQHQQHMGNANKPSRTLAILSQQVLVPLFLCTKILYCPPPPRDEDGTTTSTTTPTCPNIMSAVPNPRMLLLLLLWPIYVVSVGILIGWVITQICDTPPHHVRSVLAACGFGNSAGLPITLLHVLHTNITTTTPKSQTDPSMFLSVFLLIYPVLQWGIGGWLLDPNSVVDQPLHVVVDAEHTSTDDNSTDRYIDSLKLVPPPNSPRHKGNSPKRDDKVIHSRDEDFKLIVPIPRKIHASTKSSGTPAPAVRPIPWYRTVLERCCPPPVVGALTGIVITMIPGARGCFVNVNTRNHTPAPLQFVFDGLYTVGRTAVPVSMMILGCNLASSSSISSSSTSQQQNNARLQNDNVNDSVRMPNTSIVGIVVGKMVLMPIIGIVSVWALKGLIETSRTTTMPADHASVSSLYLVLMIVFLTPTANNVIVMVELSGAADVKADIARAIAWQYLIAPVILSLSLSIAVAVANGSSSS